jgi:aspartate/methionine/tyrosine aminotransferase
VATIAGTGFGALGEGHVRLSYANSLDDIREAMRRLDGWLRQHTSPRRTA